MAKKETKYFKMQVGVINKNLKEGHNDFCVNRRQNIWSSVEVKFPDGYIYNRLTPTDKRVFQAVGTLYKRDMLDDEKDEKSKYIFSLSEIASMCGFSNGKKNLERVRHSLNKLKVMLISINMQEEVEHASKDYSDFKQKFKTGTCTITDSCIDWQEYEFKHRGETKIKYLIKTTPILFAYNDKWNTISNERLELLQSTHSDNIQIALTDYIIERINMYKYKKGLNHIKMSTLQEQVEKDAAEKIDKTHFSRFTKRILDFFKKLKENRKIDDFKQIKKKNKLIAIEFTVKQVQV